MKKMVYDAMQLAHQVTEAEKSHRRKTDGKAAEYKPSSAEYLSGFYKTDKLLPVVTLVIFWGPEKWDGPLSLKEMYAAMDEAIMQCVPDYKVNLIAPGQMSEEEIREFKTSLKEVMLYIKYSKDEIKLRKVTQSEPGFRNLERQAADVINVMTNSKLKYPEGKETVDMCVAIEKMKMDSRTEGKMEGKIEGAVETYMEFNLSLQETIQRIADKFNLSLAQAREEVEKYWE